MLVSVALASSGCAAQDRRRARRARACAAACASGAATGRTSIVPGSSRMLGSSARANERSGGSDWLRWRSEGLRPLNVGAASRITSR